MTYRLSMAVDANLCMEIEEQVFDDLLDLFERMGGDRQWLINAAKASVARSLHGEAAGNVVRSMNGSVHDADATAEQRSAGGRTVSNARGASDATATGDAGTTRTARRSDEPADPWAGDRSDYPGEATVARRALTGTGPSDGDPWGEDTASDPNGRERPAQGRAQGAERPARGRGGTETTSDKFGREFTTGLPEAPDCECGQSAARMKAKGRDSGKWYTKWVCAKAVGSDYRDKCGYSEFVS
jgi:hypothetical protein